MVKAKGEERTVDTDSFLDLQHFTWQMCSLILVNFLFLKSNAVTKYSEGQKWL